MIVRENPSRTTEVVGEVATASPAAVDAVVRRAEAAYRRWSATAIDERLAALRAGADALTARVDELAVLLARESGKVRADSAGELGFSATYLRWVTAHAAAVLADEEIDDDAGRLILRRRPFGVIAAVTPWNAPIILAMLKIGPALAAGNTLVVKPSPLAPLTISAVVELLAAHLPADVLQVVHGDAEAGAALVGHELVAKVAFTGGGAAARHVAAQAATRTTPTVLELGGNDPAVFLPDADLSPAAMERLVLASFATSGQVCMAAKRLYVPDSRHDEFVEAYTAAADRVLRTGDALAEGVTMGPMINAAAVARVEGLVADAVQAGARAVALGGTDPGTDLAGGYFLTPTLLLDVPEQAAVVGEEQFGPTVPLLRYTDVDEVLARANAGELGLGASVWSADEERAFDFARRFEAGFVFVNTHNRTGLTLRAPFGGVKRSGYGREYGEEGLREYAQTCVIHAPAAFRPGGTALAANAYPA